MILAIDFDGVIHDSFHPVPGHRMGGPMEGAVEALRKLKGAGHTIIVHTVRTGQYLNEWFAYYQIPYDEITNVKPNADIYLDDRAVRFTSWAEFKPLGVNL